ncbi:uncharacterized protein FIESC28_04062 [Fusarium coffeatum]|uniref:Uncharacterized protein n=1 Tax=Fusarium coffeatum TaxID=231269 RepID=A0A366S157_9HYPO|nr:uncharacterized protein FIESC28_04062 [Fusarium coffeatum]RBR23067.1 hypothetical protein FIESC28_04062 [Fusarium coffeatum]
MENGTKMSSSPGCNPSQGTKTSLTLTDLPIEILSHSLSFLPNRRPVRNAITSCSALHDAFKNKPSYIASCVLFNSMSDGVFEEACVVNNLKNESWKGAKAGIKAIHRAYNSRMIPGRDLTFENVKEMWKLHKAVVYFGRQIPRTLINENPVTSQKDYFYVTRLVRSRFQRALYRFSAYLDIMEKLRASPLHDHGGKSRPLTEAEKVEAPAVTSLSGLDDHRVLLAWHSHYCTVEIEQVSGICGLLINQIAPTFNDFLEHDVELGSRLHKYIVHPQQPRSMSPIALGLPFLHKFMTAPARTLQQDVIYPVLEHVEWNPRDISRIPFPSTDEALNAKVFETDARPGMWANEPLLECIIRTPFFKDPDKGPPLPWGYVFWDLNMLENAGFKNINMEDRINSDLDVTFPEGHFDREAPCPLERYGSNRATELLFFAQHEKHLMRKRGETGYFNFEAFCESVKDRLVSNMPGIPEGIMGGLLDVVPAEHGLNGLLEYMAAVLANET